MMRFSGGKSHSKWSVGSSMAIALPHPSPPSSSSLSSSALFECRRHIIQSHKGGGMRSVLDQYTSAQLAQKLSRNKNGNYYRFQRKLWPTTEAMEIELSKSMYSSVERTPPQLLPQPAAAKQRRSLVMEGRGAVALMERAASDVENATSAQTSALTDMLAGEDMIVVDETQVEMLRELGQQPINNKILTEEDIQDTSLDSAIRAARRTIEEDLLSNSLQASGATDSDSTALALPAADKIRAAVTDASAKDPGGVVWQALGLDPVMSDVARQFLGPSATRLQTRLLPALLNEDHNDVIFNGVTGSGKTAALLLALLQGVRSESAGMNVFVASNAMNAMRAHDAIRAMCRRAGCKNASKDSKGMGGALVDRPQDDFSWLLLAPFREQRQAYYDALQETIGSNHGPARLMITTADVFCELFFEHKLEYERFGYLRRVYVDDVGPQIPMIAENAPVEEMKERLRNPVAAELLLATLHQLPGPHIRSIMQLALVSADVDERLKNHLKSLCVKPEANTVCLAPVQLPTTIHCLFSFHLFTEDVYAHTVALMRRVDKTIPGRAVIFIRQEDDMLDVRERLRRLGMDAKLFSEVYHDGGFHGAWRFMLLRESEAYGVDLPLVSHVFITFVPKTGQSYQHMAGRCGRLGNVGWVYTVADRRFAKPLRQVVENVNVDFKSHVIDKDLNQVGEKEVESLTGEFSLHPLDPQYVVRHHYEVQTENPDHAFRSREFFSRNKIKEFKREDYTPVGKMHKRFTNAQKLAKDVDQDPSVVLRLVQKRYLDRSLKPTKRLKRALDVKSRKHNGSVY